MRNRQPVFVNLICFFGGIGVGGAVVGLWVKHAKSEWVEAYGTWFGAVATVVAVLWAVQTFRHDERRRQAQRDEEALDDAVKRLAAEAAEFEQASQVSVNLHGGGGYGHEGAKTMNSVHVHVRNDTGQAVTVFGFDLGDNLSPLDEIGLPMTVTAYGRWDFLIPVFDFAAPDEEFMDRPLTGHTARVRFRLAGREWEKPSNGQPPARVK